MSDPTNIKLSDTAQKLNRLADEWERRLPRDHSKGDYYSGIRQGFIISAAELRGALVVIFDDETDWTGWSSPKPNLLTVDEKMMMREPASMGLWALLKRGWY